MRCITNILNIDIPTSTTSLAFVTLF
jgi:hypothetical protein